MKIYHKHFKDSFISRPMQPQHWKRKLQPSPVFLPGKSHGQRSQADPLQSMGSQELDTTWQQNHHKQSQQ